VQSFFQFFSFLKAKNMIFM
jgi:hypothetical protein